MAVQSEPERISNIFSGAAFIFACRVGGAALTFGTQVLLARWMGAEELGLYVLAFSWCLLLTTLSALGLPFAAIRFIGDGLARADSGQVKAFVLRGAQIVLTAGVVVTLTGLAITHTMTPSAAWFTSWTFVFALLALPFYALLRFATGCANALSLFALSFVPNNLVRPASFLLAVTVVWFAGRTLNAATAMFWHMVVIAMVAVVTWFVLSRRLQEATNIGDGEYRTGYWLRISLPLLLLDIFSGYLPELTVVVLGGFLSSADLAVYNAAFRTAMLIMFGLNAVDAYIAPSISRAYAANDRATLVRSVNRATQLRFWGAIAAAALLLPFGDYVLSIFGPEFVAGHSALSIFTIGLVISAGVGPVVRILSVTGHQDHCILVFMFSAILAVLLIAVLTPRFGLSGAAAAAASAMAVSSLLMRLLVVKLVDLRPRILGNAS